MPPEIGKTYRLKRLVEGKDAFTGANTDLQPGLVGEVIAIVKADEDGAGDHTHDCAVIQFESGRTWSHPIKKVKASLLHEHRGEDGLPHPKLAPTVGFDDLFEEV
jgi:hypothetical protein